MEIVDFIDELSVLTGGYSIIILPLMVMELPAVIDCRKIPEQGLHILGTVSPKRISRLDSEFNLSKPVSAQIDIKIGAFDKIHLAGELSAELSARCQRCLGWMRIPIEIEFNFELQETEPKGKQFSENGGEDNITLTDGVLNLMDVVEDEILLSCPMIPNHEEHESCIHNLTETPLQSGSQRQKPFADLDKIFKNKSKNE